MRCIVPCLPWQWSCCVDLSGQVTPCVTKPAPLVEKGQFIDSIKSPLSSQDEIRNVLISPTQIQAAENMLSSLRWHFEAILGIKREAGGVIFREKLKD